ncbi:unnamed protein product [Malus baccata var. baccata]
MTDSADESNAKADHSIIQVGEEKERIEREISHVSNQSWSGNKENEDELIASWIERKLPKESTEEPVHTCIFRVPTKHVRDNENAFVPQVVSIGPYHRGREKLQGMEQTKLRYLLHLLNRKPTPDTSLGKFVKEIRSREEFLRKCYEEKSYHLSSYEFVEMMVVDGCFILELLRKSVSPFPGRFSTFKNDLLLLENQLPWQVLDCLFNLTKTSEEISLYQLTLELSENMRCTIETGTLEIRHLLDAVRNSLFGSSWREKREYYRDWSHWTPIPSATHLEETGVKFQPAYMKSQLEISFNMVNGVMKIPYMIIEDNTESLFRNLIVYEQCQLVGDYDTCPVLSYAMLFNQLIKSTKDLLSLTQKEIIDTNLSVEDTVRFFDRLRYDTEHMKFFYSDLALDVNQYYHSRSLRRWLAGIKRDYLYNPKSILSLFSNAVILALILTAIQTVYGILAYYKQN